MMVAGDRWEFRGCELERYVMHVGRDEITAWLITDHRADEHAVAGSRREALSAIADRYPNLGRRAA